MLFIEKNLFLIPIQTGEIPPGEKTPSRR